MATPVKMRVIFGEDDVHRLILPEGIPSTLNEFKNVLQKTFSIAEPFTVKYQDLDFDGQFFTLTSIEDVKDRMTLRIALIEPVVLTLSPVEMSDVESFQPSSAETSFSSGSDTVLLSSSDESGSSRSMPWPLKFEIPDFPYDVNIALEAATKAYEKDGTFLNNPRVTSSILEKLAEVFFGFISYPNSVQILAVVEALVGKYPCLKEPGSFNGLYGWQQRIKYKLGNYRAKLRGSEIDIPELEVNTLKRRRSVEADMVPIGLKGLKRPKKAEVNYLPPMPSGANEHSLEKERLELLTEVNKSNNDRIINQKMEKSFALRRKEVVQECPAVPDLLERWPALFSQKQVGVDNAAVIYM